MPVQARFSVRGHSVVMCTAARLVASFAAMTALMAWPPASGAQSVSDATVESLLRSAASSPTAAAAASAPLQRPLWRQHRAIDLSSLRVIELPDEQPQLGPRSRRHHALTWRNDSLSKALDNAGMANAECHNRVRLPSRLRAAPDGGPALQVQLQLAIGCSF
jgi:hypothetical protein